MSRTLPGLARGALTIAAMGLLAVAASAQESPATADADADDVQHIRIVGGSYFFRPAQIVARANQPLEIRVSMEPGLIPHSFVLEGPDGQRLADMPLNAQEQTLRLTLAPGSYPFYCPNRLLLFQSHRAHGMAGMLQVQE